MDLLNRTAVAERITQLGTAARNVQADIHLCGVSTIAHMREHGDYRGALQLLNALPNGVRVKALVEWYREFTSGKFTVSFDAKEKVYKGSLKKERTAEDFKVEAAIEISFADFTKERDPKPVTLAKLIGMIKSKADESDPAKVTDKARIAAASILAFCAEKGFVTQE